MLQRVKHSIFRRHKQDIVPGDVAHARKYIANYWPKLERYHPEDDHSLVGLPNKYLVPSYAEDHSFDFNEMYYWDSYFMVQGMYDAPHKELVVGILENLLSMQERFKIVPNASRTYLMGRSQPPFLTTFIFEVYQNFKMDKAWLKRAIGLAHKEYEHVWMGTKKPNERLAYEGLSRYYDVNHLHDLAEAESGWDMTPRFNRRALDFLPVDLNALLYKYETDFAKAAEIFGDKKTAQAWMKRAEKRKNAMNELMWSSSRNFFFDYNFVKKRRGNVSSLAGFYPMWAGMVDDWQAEQLVKALKRFDEKGGLATTDQQFNQRIPGGGLPNTVPTQWAFPNGWAPLQFIVVEALQGYGYYDEAEKIARKWLKTNLDWFNKHGVFLEKYNVDEPDQPPKKGLYPAQTGFGWTNAVFERFCQDFIDKK